MKKRYVVYFLLIILIALLLAIPKLLTINVPPSVDIVQKCFDDNRNDILLITSFLSQSGFDDMYISDANERVVADFSTIVVYDDKVNDAITRLVENDIYIHISKMDQTISFLQWTGLRDIGCGIVYTKHIDESIESGFFTELMPLSDEHWFYYVSDYNAWRNGEIASKNS